MSTLGLFIKARKQCSLLKRLFTGDKTLRTEEHLSTDHFVALNPRRFVNRWNSVGVAAKGKQSRRMDDPMRNTNIKR